MTDINVDELIAEAKRRRDLLGGWHTPDDALEFRLADALAQLQRERDEALAVIELAKGWGENVLRMDDALALRRILRAGPADALRAVKAEAWDEGFEAWMEYESEDCPGPMPWSAKERNPYREETTRG